MMISRQQQETMLQHIEAGLREIARRGNADAQHILEHTSHEHRRYHMVEYFETLVGVGHKMQDGT